MTVPDVTILGAGIAGLAAAIACARAGRTVDVIEQAPALTEVGAGLQIAPNGLRVLQALGVSVPGIDSSAIRVIDGPTGRHLIRMPLGAGFRLVHRADLVAALADRLNGVGLRLGERVASISDGGRELALNDGTQLPVKTLIGADGARGASRGFVAPDHVARFTGQVAWRAIVPVRDWPAEAQIHVGPGRHMVLYPLRDATMLNIVAVEERSEWTADGWSHRADPKALQDAFAEYAAPIRTLLDRVEMVNIWGLMDHGITPEWTRGACTLIGDAAHPTLPFLAQGANLALEDAWSVARHLHAPQAYVAARRPRVARALAAAASNARNYHLTGVRRLGAHGALRLLDRIAPSLMARKYDWLYDYDVTATQTG